MNSDVKKLHRARLEWILLGMILAKGEDRETILDKVGQYDLQGEIVVSCMGAIIRQDFPALQAAFRQLGIELEEPIPESIADNVLTYVREERAREVLTRAMMVHDMKELGALEKTLESALCEIRG